MKRFLMLVGVAVVAAAMYVAASPASQQAKGPSAKQFKALQKQVATLKKSLKATQTEADAAVSFLANCLVSQNAGVVGVSQFGDSTTGFLFGDASSSTPRSALDADSSTTPGAFLQAVDPTCVNSSPLRHLLKPGSRGMLPFTGERSHSH